MQLLLKLKNRDSVAVENKILYDKNQTGNFLTLEQIAAQCHLFLAVGLETSATTMTFTLYELAMHPEIQEKLREEISAVLMEHNREITYEAVMQMDYLDRVINGKTFKSFSESLIFIFIYI